MILTIKNQTSNNLRARIKILHSYDEPLNPRADIGLDRLSEVYIEKVEVIIYSVGSDDP